MIANTLHYWQKTLSAEETEKSIKCLLKLFCLQLDRPNDVDKDSLIEAEKLVQKYFQYLTRFVKLKINNSVDKSAVRHEHFNDNDTTWYHDKDDKADNTKVKVAADFVPPDASAAGSKAGWAGRQLFAERGGAV